MPASLNCEGAAYAFRDNAAHADGKFTVAFLDGHVERGGNDVSGPNPLCIHNVHKDTQAMLMYSQDYNETLPAMHDLPRVGSLIDVIKDRGGTYTDNPE